MVRQRLSLKARALAWLGQREHSRTELRRKLLRVARQELADREAAARTADVRSPQGEPAAGCADPERCVDALLDWLEQHRYLSETRFVESRVHARAQRYGNLRIQQELAQHGVAPDAETLSQLKASEYERAKDVWQRKFGAAAADAADRAKQMRFLAQRGFSAEVVRRVVRCEEE